MCAKKAGGKWMANQEHVDVLKQGIEVWNKWRDEYPDIQPDLRGAILSWIDLSWIWISDRKPSYDRANLANVDFSDAELSWAILTNANLTGANLSKANLGGAKLFGVLLTNANLSETKLYDTNLSSAYLKGANFHQAKALRTLFTNVDLSEARGLETVQHHGPSSIGIDTIIASQGKIPEIFLRGAGIPPSIIETIPSLIGSLNPIDFYSCFISYSSKDKDFAERLYADLQAKGVSCWLDKEDLKIGEMFRPRIDEAIRRHDKLLLVLSQHSVKSAWVETEVETAFEKERRYKKLMLFPIRLDEAVIRTRQAWAADIRRQRHIGDFTCWKDHDAYQKAFTRLLRDLKAEAQNTEAREGTANSG
jgi:hypothetical protein